MAELVTKILSSVDFGTDAGSMTWLPISLAA
jgi:hypothetical protein